MMECVPDTRVDKTHTQGNKKMSEWLEDLLDGQRLFSDPNPDADTSWMDEQELDRPREVHPE